MAVKISAKDNEISDIVRDSTFHRFVADRVIVTDLGSEIEVSFLQIGPEHIHVEINGDVEEFTSKPIFTEVARMRSDHSTFLNALMSYLKTGVDAGKFKGHEIAKNIQSWADEAGAEESDDD